MTFQSKRHDAGESLKWIVDHVSYPHDYCLIWPFTKKESGYPSVICRKEGNIYPTRYMCELVKGLPPTPEHQAAHSCGRGHLACINPKHLSWKTPSENQLDRRQHGTINQQRKITPEQALEIRSLKSLEPTGETAKRFGLRESTVRLIQSGKTWRADLHQTFRSFSDDEVRMIRSQKGIKGMPRKLAAQFGVNDSAIRHIQAGRTYKHVPRAAE